MKVLKKYFWESRSRSRQIGTREKECYDYYFDDAYWRKNNLDKPILTNSPKKVSKYKELFGGDKEWQQ